VEDSLDLICSVDDDDGELTYLHVVVTPEMARKLLVYWNYFTIIRTTDPTLYVLQFLWPESVVEAFESIEYETLSYSELVEPENEVWDIYTKPWMLNDGIDAGPSNVYVTASGVYWRSDVYGHYQTPVLEWRYIRQVADGKASSNRDFMKMVPVPRVL